MNQCLSSVKLLLETSWLSGQQELADFFVAYIYFFLLQEDVLHVMTNVHVCACPTSIGGWVGM